MSFSHARICSQIFDEPLAYHPGKAEAAITALGRRLTGHSVTVVNGQGPTDHVAFENGRLEAGVLGDGMGRAFDRAGVRPFQTVDGIAMIPIEGTLVQKGAWIGSYSGETSYQGLQVQISRAAHDDVKAAVFEVDSFGGLVNGMFETAGMIRALSQKKPTIAILTDFAYSAAYLLASQARQIIVPQFGGVGSIGAMTMHADFSGNLEQEGIKVTLIHAGSHKADGSPFAPLPDDLREKLQGRVDAVRDRFATEVGAARGKRFSKSDAMKTEARSIEPDEAMKIGLVDAIGDPNEAFAAFVAEINGRSGR